MSGITPGQVVTSRAGRDKGRMYVVLASCSDRYATVADGQYRTVKAPKRKNVKHLVVHECIATAVRQALLGARRVTDEQIRMELNACRELPDHGREEGSTADGKGRCD